MGISFVRARRGGVSYFRERGRGGGEGRESPVAVAVAAVRVDEDEAANNKRTSSASRWLPLATAAGSVDPVHNPPLP